MHIHFFGIGGAGIAPLAQIAQEAGYIVSGSNEQNTSYIDYLKHHGLTNISIGDSADIIRDLHGKQPIDWVVYSSAVPMQENGRKQLDIINTMGLKCTKRDEFISDFLKTKKLKMIAIAGTYGKTTTTAMLTWLTLQLHKPVSYLIPAKVSFAEMGLYNPESEYFIYEADEYDRNFLAFSAELSVITGIAWDHHEVYPTYDNYLQAFREFIAQSKQTVIWSSDARRLGLEASELLIQADNLTELDQITLKGLSNRQDAWLSLVAVSKLFETETEKLISLVNQFPGLDRRMEEIYPGLYSDYAHTPDKIRGAISVISEIAKEKNKPFIVLYEPLTNRRQLYIKNDYQDCFTGASHVYWLPSYLAREDPKDRIIRPAELIDSLSDPSIASAVKPDQKLIHLVKEHLAQGYLVVAMAGGGGGSLDDYLREHFRPQHQS